MHTQTAGLGSLERRDYIMHPPAAKKESEIYDCIISWEREIREQEKMLEPSQRPLISAPLKMTIIKIISCGNIKEYTKTHEAIMNYEELRAQVLQMSVFSKTENDTKTHKPEAMDISELTKNMHKAVKRIKEEQN